jgi:class 3 adenylate cyclase
MSDPPASPGACGNGSALADLSHHAIAIVKEASMGVATGDLVVGTIGSTDARSFTVIGDTVRHI